MSLPASNSPVWARLASGGLSRIQTSHLGTQMLIKRLELSKDPPATKATEIYSYFQKWERSLANEVAQLARL
ncbi:MULTISPECIES: hypothetical protein [Sphingomonadaceae]|uniref:hypothetical protein n=1 Tax=Sphingomonadaceae TaxID=41297 RepID=UPI001157224D|nr:MULTISPECIES: hypothetical protein [Sphingomonadaceae]QDK33101.1 hypothetical protein DM450_10010 [Sphingomonas sp. IC081]QSR18198.1 hypothetical protein CA833_13530 [Novosphingobium sp. KA1]